MPDVCKWSNSIWLSHIGKETQKQFQKATCVSDRRRKAATSRTITSSEANTPKQIYGLAIPVETIVVVDTCGPAKKRTYGLCVTLRCTRRVVVVVVVVVLLVVVVVVAVVVIVVVVVLVVVAAAASVHSFLPLTNGIGMLPK